MSIRCDFYLGRGAQAVYLGSIGHGAHAEEMAERFTGVQDPSSFEERLRNVFAEYGEIPASHGWPWPWETSETTDTVIAFDAGRCWAADPDGCWAPLDDLEHPTQEPCVYPNMLEQMQSVPLGRLSHRLRHGTQMQMVPLNAVMAGLLRHVGTRLSQLLLHGFWREGSFLVLESFVSFESHLAELRCVAHVLERLREDFELLLAECKECMPELPWALLECLRETGGGLGVETLELTLAADVPVFFGEPAPEREFGAKALYARFTDVRFPRVYELWTELLNEAPIVYAQALANAMMDHSVLPVRRAEAVAWLNAKRPEFGDKALVEACATAEGRAQALRWAAGRLFRE